MLNVALFFGSPVMANVLSDFFFYLVPITLDYFRPFEIIMNNRQNQPKEMFYLVKELKIAIASLLFSVFGSAMFFFETMVPLSKWFLLVGVLGIVLVLFLIFKKSISK